MSRKPVYQNMYALYCRSYKRPRSLSSTIEASLPTNIPAKDVRLDPVQQDQRAVASAETHVDVRRLDVPHVSIKITYSKRWFGKVYLPEPIGDSSPTSNVPTQPTNICHGLVMSNVR